MRCVLVYGSSVALNATLFLVTLGCLTLSCASRTHVAADPDMGWMALPADACGRSLERVAELDQPTELGFSAVEAVQHLSGERSSALVWLEPTSSREYEFEFGPEHAASSLLVSVALAPGELLYRRNVGEPPEGVDCGADALLIPVDITLQSEGRALDETFRTVLETSSLYRARFSQRFAAGTLAGGLLFSKPDSLDPKRAFSLGNVLLDVVLWEGGSQGTLSVEVEASSRVRGGSAPELPVERQPSIAVWPSAAACPDGWAALPSDARLVGASARDALAELTRHSAEALRWSDGSAAELRMEFEQLPEFLCQALGDELEFESALHAESSDGRVDSRLPLLVRATWAGARFGEISIARADASVEGESAAVVNARELRESSSWVDIAAEYRPDGATGSLRLLDPGTAEAGRVRASGEWSR